MQMTDLRLNEYYYGSWGKERGYFAIMYFCSRPTETSGPNYEHNNMIYLGAVKEIERGVACSKSIDWQPATPEQIILFQNCKKFRSTSDMPSHFTSERNFLIFN